MRGGQHRLFDRDRIGCRKGILEGLVERFFMPLALALVANCIVPVRLVVWLGDHLDLLDQTRPCVRSAKQRSKKTQMSTFGDGVEMFKAICKLGLEGIVSKKLDAPYKSGPSKAWLKIKNPKAPAATRAADGTF